MPAIMEAQSTDRLSEIDRKLDLICAEIEQQRRYRIAFEDLIADLNIVAKEALPRLSEMGDRLASTLPHLLDLLGELTRPEVLTTLETIASGFREAKVAPRGDVSMLALIREANTPEARRGLDMLIRTMKAAGAVPTKKNI